MFKEYFTMQEDDAIHYIKEVLPDLFTLDSNLECKEIGDGNLNYVFRIWDPVAENSIIVKQSGPVARISDDFELSPDRNRIEAELLKYQNTLAPGFVPEVYHYDPVMHCTIMDDLSDHVILRTGLLDSKNYDDLAKNIAYFMVKTLLHSTDIVLAPDVKKAMVQNYINPELCKISEDLVFTEPYDDINNRNILFTPHEKWLKDMLYQDDALKLKSSKLKYQFMNHAQSLLHGDLHTGSIFIKQGSMKVIDPEFAFYGPMGYDIGNVLANLIFAYTRAYFLDVTKQADYLMDTIESVVDMFKEYFIEDWAEYATEETAHYVGVKENYLSEVLSDTAGFCGTECIRRIVGLAQVKDIHAIDDVSLRMKAEKAVVLIGKNLMMNQEDFNFGSDYRKLIDDVLKGDL